MSRLIADSQGMFLCEIQVHDEGLADALEHEHADELLECAVIVALCTLAESDGWPEELMESMSGFMADMERFLDGPSNRNT
jgi:hypothetical protein